MNTSKRPEHITIELSYKTRDFLHRVFKTAKYDNFERQQRMNQTLLRLIGAQNSQGKNSDPQGFYVARRNKTNVELVLGTLASYIQDESGVQCTQEFTVYDAAFKAALRTLRIPATEAEEAFNEIKDKSSLFREQVSQAFPEEAIPIKELFKLEFPKEAHSVIAQVREHLRFNEDFGGRRNARLRLIRIEADYSTAPRGRNLAREDVLAVLGTLEDVLNIQSSPKKYSVNVPMRSALRDLVNRELITMDNLQSAMQEIEEVATRQLGDLNQAKRPDKAETWAQDYLAAAKDITQKPIRR